MMHSSNVGCSTSYKTTPTAQASDAPIRRAGNLQSHSAMAGDLQIVRSAERPTDSALRVLPSFHEAFPLRSWGKMSTTQDTQYEATAHATITPTIPTAITKTLDTRHNPILLKTYSFRSVTNQDVINLANEINESNFLLVAFCRKNRLSYSTMSKYYSQGILTDRARARLQGVTLRHRQFKSVCDADLLTMEEFTKEISTSKISIAAWAKNHGIKRSTMHNY